MPLIIGAKSASAATGVANSCRFNGGDSPYFASDFSGTGSSSAAIATYSFWVKLSLEDDRATLISGKDDTSNYMKIRFADDGAGWYFGLYGVSPACDLKSTPIFQDPSAWYNVVMAFDTAQATDTNRIKVWVNGVQITSWSTSTFIAQNEELFLTKSNDLEIGAYNNTEHFDGYMAEVVCIDGTALDETSFGEFDEDSPTIWKPKDVSGLTFGTKGYYLDFEDSAALGADVSGNGNDFTETNIVAADQATDTPTNNFAVMNILDNDDNPTTFTEGNCKLTWTATNKTNKITLGMSAGKWYAECYAVDVNGGTSGTLIGVGTSACVPSTYLSASVSGWGYRCQTGYIQNGAGEEAYGDTWADDDIIGVAVDVDNGYVYMSKNGVWQDSGDPTSGASGTGAANNQPTYGAVLSGTQFFACSAYDTDSLAWNFGGSPAFTVSSGNADANGYGNFEYAPPSGYLALCTKNLGSDGG